MLSRILVVYFFIYSMAALCIYGWIKNIIWTFHQLDLVHVALGILGAVIAPIGIVHGLFC
jgi:hypothetical protein